MPFSVALDFAPPTDEDIVKLRVYEGATKSGSFALIDEATSVGAFPTYIDHYTTTQATSTTDWFSISWVDSKGAESPLSTPVQVGTVSLIWDVIRRARITDPSVSENELIGAAEAAIERYTNSADPYAPIASDYTYNQREGLALMTLARSQMASIIRVNAAGGFQAGLVSMKSTTSVADMQKSLMAMVELAEFYLGIDAGAWIFQMTELDILPTGNLNSVEQIDISRLWGVLVR